MSCLCSSGLPGDWAAPHPLGCPVADLIAWSDWRGTSALLCLPVGKANLLLHLPHFPNYCPCCGLKACLRAIVRQSGLFVRQESHPQTCCETTTSIAVRRWRKMAKQQLCPPKGHWGRGQVPLASHQAIKISKQMPQGMGYGTISWQPD